MENNNEARVLGAVVTRTAVLKCLSEVSRDACVAPVSVIDVLEALADHVPSRCRALLFMDNLRVKCADEIAYNLRASLLQSTLG